MHGGAKTRHHSGMELEKFSHSPLQPTCGCFPLCLISRGEFRHWIKMVTVVSLLYHHAWLKF